MIICIYIKTCVQDFSELHFPLWEKIVHNWSYLPLFTVGISDNSLIFSDCQRYASMTGFKFECRHTWIVDFTILMINIHNQADIVSHNQADIVSWIHHPVLSITLFNVASVIKRKIAEKRRSWSVQVNVMFILGSSAGEFIPGCSCSVCWRELRRRILRSATPVRLIIWIAEHQMTANNNDSWRL